MSVTVTCECGHVTELAGDDQPEATTTVRSHVCPACGRPLAAPTSSGKRVFQQLWRSQVSPPPSAPSLASSPDDSVAIESVTPETSAPRRSLWEVMRGAVAKPRPAAPEIAVSGASAESDAPAQATDPPAKPKGLWDVMPRTSSASSTVEGTSAEASEAATQSRAHAPTPTTNVELTPEQKYAQAASLAAMTHVASTWQPEREPEPFDEHERAWSWRARVAFTMALLAVVVSGFSVRPEWWWRVPALVIGFVSVVLGLMASSDVRRSRGRLKGRWLARGAVLLGSCGMFLAPIVFARLGEGRREQTARDEVEGRLRRIGQALDQFHNQHGHFPEASIQGRDAHGDRVPMHGWMTPLLPLLGHDPIYRRIDLTQPYDAVGNVSAMQQPIPEFTLPRRQPVRSPRGFALTHFSGVGGQEVREPTGVVHLGMFNDRGPVRRDDFTDGLSQTIIVGEIRDALPPWGEPGNVRSIGDGLNRQFRGFGNAAGTGATFLHADGSVKFYSNKTDLRVLQRLETRDGAEPE